MKTIRSDDQLLSVDGVEDSFSGRSKLRTLTNKVLSRTLSAYIEAKRPIFQPSFSPEMMKPPSEQIEQLELEDDQFSVSFNFHWTAQTSFDEFVKLLLELWCDYEQPFFCFFPSVSYKRRKIPQNLSWKEVVALETCLVMFKSVEEDVVWIGNSTEFEIKFD